MSDDNFQENLFNLSGSEMPENNTKAKKIAPLDFSYSRMDMYRTCPMKYKFRYVDKMQEEPKGFFFFGNAIHHALEFLYKGNTPIFPSIEDVCADFLEFWFSKPLAMQGFRSNEEAEKKKNEGLAMLREYYKANEQSFTRAFLTERMFKFEIDGLMVTAISDRIDYIGNGKILITDYKTGKDIKRTPNQLYMYQKAAECNPELPILLKERLGIEEQKLQISQMLYYHVPTNKRYYFDRASDDEIKEFWDKALETAEQIKSKKFEPNPSENNCRWCDFKHLCPIFAYEPKQQIKECKDISAEKNTNKENGSSLMQLINRYGDLEERKSVIEHEQAALRQSLNDFSLAGGQYNTGRYTAQINRKKIWKAENREAIIELLQENNLYERACTLTLSGIVSLLNSNALSAEVRAKLVELLKEEEQISLSVNRNI